MIDSELKIEEEIAEDTELSDEALDRAEAPSLCSTWSTCRQ